MTAEPAVSAAIVTYRSRNHIGDAIRSVSVSAAMAALHVEIIVVDNASDDGTPELVAAEHPDVALIRNDHNLGFGRATNQALTSARAPIFLLLNPDARLEPAALGSLVAFLVERPAAGWVAPAICGGGAAESAGMLPSVRAAAGHFLFLNRLLPADRGGPWRGFQLRRQGKRPVPVEWASAAALLIRATAFRAVGGFDERIFLYGEDTDLCARLSAAGWEGWLLPRARATHAIAASSGGVSTRWLDGIDGDLRRRGAGRVRRAAFHAMAALGLFARATLSRRSEHVHRRRLRAGARRAVSLAARAMCSGRA